MKLVGHAPHGCGERASRSRCINMVVTFRHAATANGRAPEVWIAELGENPRSIACGAEGRSAMHRGDITSRLRMKLSLKLRRHHAVSISADAFEPGRYR